MNNYKTLTTEERIKKDAEDAYPTVDARKVLCHDNQGQYSRQKAYILGGIVQSNKLLGRVIDEINNYWKFDRHQIPSSSWHDKQDLLELLESLKIKGDEQSINT